MYAKLELTLNQTGDVWTIRCFFPDGSFDIMQIDDSSVDCTLTELKQKLIPCDGIQL